MYVFVIVRAESNCVLILASGPVPTGNNVGGGWHDGCYRVGYTMAESLLQVFGVGIGRACRRLGLCSMVFLHIRLMW